MVGVHALGFDALALGTQAHTGLTVFYEKFCECLQCLFGDGTSVFGFTEGALWVVQKLIQALLQFQKCKPRFAILIKIQ